jgi:chaperone required for assembly of F1-ATPase
LNTTAVRRFYKETSAAEEGSTHIVRLDQRTLRTPAGQQLKLPTKALAEAIAAEWGAQGEFIVPTSMPLTQLAFAAIDHTPQRREQLVDYIAKFAETDLVCHRAEAPAPLVARQSMLWDPLVAWGASDLGAMLPVVVGVTPALVHSETLETLRARAGACDDFQLTALAHAAGAAGSAIIAFAMLHSRLDAAAAFTASALDDIWSLDNWGEDAVARSRLERLRGEFDAVSRFFAALSAA